MSGIAGVFEADSPLVRFLTRVADLMILNLLQRWQLRRTG